MDASEDKFYAVSRRRCDVPSNWSQTELNPIDQDISDHTFGGYDYNADWVAKFFTRAGQTPPDVEFRMSANFGCDPHAKSLNENYFQYYPDGPERAKTFYNTIIPRLKAIKTDDAAYASLSTQHKNDLDRVITKCEEVWYPYEIEFAATLQGTHGSLRGAIGNLFLDAIASHMDFDKYFAMCNIDECQYADTTVMSTSAIASVLLGLVGGIVSGASMLFASIYAALETRIVNNSKAAEQKEVPAEENEPQRVPQDEPGRAGTSPQEPGGAGGRPGPALGRGAGSWGFLSASFARPGPPGSSWLSWTGPTEEEVSIDVKSD